MNKFSKKPSFKETSYNSVITQFALALTACKVNEWHPSGTAIVIAPFLAITAKHVIEDYLQKYGDLVPDRNYNGEKFEISATYSLVAHQFQEEGKVGVLWSITRLWVSGLTDVAFLELTPASESALKYKWQSARLNLIPPSVGERIAAFGYHSSEIDIDEDETEIKVNWKNSPTTSIGEVLEVHNEKRDSSFLRFPCYRTNARFDGGMSGGPVFNSNGELCGLICTGSNLMAGEDGHISYVASLWPSMATEIDMVRPGFATGGFYPVLELAKHGHIDAIGWERIVIFKEPAAGRQSVALKTD